MKKLERFILRDILSDGPAGTVYKAEEVLPGDNRRTVAARRCCRNYKGRLRANRRRRSDFLARCGCWRNWGFIRMW